MLIPHADLQISRRPPDPLHGLEDPTVASILRYRVREELLKILQILMILLAFSTSLTAKQPQRWTNVSPIGGDMTLVVDRSDSNRWFAYDQVLYRSENGARAWTKLPGVNYTYRVQVQPTTSWLLAVGKGTTRESSPLFISTNHGDSFTLAGTVRNLDLFLDPLSSRLFQTDGTKILKSTDTGSTWKSQTVAFTPLPAHNCSPTNFQIDQILPSPLDQNTLYLSIDLQNCPVVEGRRMYVSVIAASHDGGSTWAEEYSAINVNLQFLFDSANPVHAYVYAKYGPQAIAILSNGVWMNLKTPPCLPAADCTLQALAVVPHQPDQLIVVQEARARNKGSTFKIWRTSDSGQTWSATDSPFYGYLHSLYVADSDPPYWVATSRTGGVYRLDSLWQPVNSGFTQRITFMKVVAAGQTVYAFADAYYGRLLYRSTNGGKSWNDLEFKLPRGAIAAFAMHPRDPKHVIIEMATGDLYRRTTGEFYSSLDGGETWSFLFRIRDSGSYRDVIAFDPNQAGVVYFSTSGKVFKSVQDGRTPAALAFNLGGVTQIFLPPDVPGTVFLINGQVFQSNDSGRNIFYSSINLPYVDEGESAGWIARVAREGYLVENDDAAIFRSSNGRNWHGYSYLNAGRGGGGDPPGAGPFYVYRNHGYAVCHGGLFESVNGGRRWRIINLELDAEAEYSASDLSDPALGPLYVATNGGILKAGSE